MGHPVIDSTVPFAFEPLFLGDEDARPVLVPLVKATYAIGPKGLVRADEQVPINLGGEFHGEPESSSHRYEPEGAFVKPATDVVLLGHAHAPRIATTEMQVSLRVGSLRKVVRVLGERTWFKVLGGIEMTRPLPFERIALQYERAFGGWDRSHPDPAQHQFEPRNPVGRGFRGSHSRFEEGLLLPNLETPGQPLTRWGQRVAPASFGFVSPHWQPRAALAGTYDETWVRTRRPLLPRDFDRRFMNAASPGLIAEGYLRGDEPVELVGATSEGRLSFLLPAQSPPRVRVVSARRADADVAMNLDTLIIDADAKRVLVLWRGLFALRRDPTEVKRLVVDSGVEATRAGSPPVVPRG